jgi:hypothetical protein
MHCINPDDLTFSVNAAGSTSCLEGGLGVYRFLTFDGSAVALLDSLPDEALESVAERSSPGPLELLRLLRGANPAFNSLHSKHKSAPCGAVAELKLSEHLRQTSRKRSDKNKLSIKRITITVCYNEQGTSQGQIQHTSKSRRAASRDWTYERVPSLTQLRRGARLVASAAELLLGLVLCGAESS